MRQCPCRARRVGNGELRRQAEAVQPLGEIGEQRVLSAEEMRRTRDVEKESIRAVRLAPRRHEGRVARGPQREPLQRRIVGNGIDVAHLQHACFRPRIGDEILLGQSFRFRRFVQGGNARPAGSLDGEDKGPLWINRFGGRFLLLCGEEAQDRPPRQPD